MQPYCSIGRLGPDSIYSSGNYISGAICRKLYNSFNLSFKHRKKGKEGNAVELKVSQVWPDSLQLKQKPELKWKYSDLGTFAQMKKKERESRQMQLKAEWGWGGGAVRKPSDASVILPSCLYYTCTCSQRHLHTPYGQIFTRHADKATSSISLLHVQPPWKSCFWIKQRGCR